MTVSLLENWLFHHKLIALSYAHYAFLKDFPHHVTKYENDCTSKILIFQHFSDLWIGKNLEVYAAQDNKKHHFEMQILNLWINWEILYPNLSLTVENNMGNSHKKAGHILNLT